MPFITPITRVMALPASPSVRALITGMPPATAASKRRLTPRVLRRLGQCLTVMGEHRLVGRDHVLAVCDRGLGGVLGGAVLAAHEFHENVHVVAAGERDGVVLPRVGA